jgi:glutamate mutase epsilon subunit
MEDQSAPATKQDIAAAEQRLDEKIELLRSEVNHGYRDIVERISDSETRLLKAFYDFAQSNQKRMSDLETSDSGMRSRLATIEDRLLEVEKRLNMPPAA